MNAEATWDSTDRPPNLLLAPVGSKPSFVVLEPPPTEDQIAPSDRYADAHRSHVSRPLVWVCIVLLSLSLVAAGVWGLVQSTWTYGMTSVDAETTARLLQVHAELATAGAPEAALRHLEKAALPGVNIGDAIEALVDTDKALRPMVANATIVSIRHQLRAIEGELKGQRYGGSRFASVEPQITVSQLPTLALPQP